MFALSLSVDVGVHELGPLYDGHQQTALSSSLLTQNFFSLFLLGVPDENKCPLI